MCSYIWFAIHPLFIKKNLHLILQRKREKKKTPDKLKNIWRGNEILLL